MSHEKTNLAANLVILSIPAIIVIIAIYFASAFIINKHTYAENMKKYQAGTDNCKRIEKETVEYFKRVGDMSDPVTYFSGVRHVMPSKDNHLTGCFYPSKPIPPELAHPQYSNRFDGTTIGNRP